MREALFQIWLNRDYTKFGQAVERDMSLPKWTPSAHMRLYIRKDMVNQLWNYGSAPAPEAVIPDPFDGKQADLTAKSVIGAAGNQPGQLQRPRDLVVAPDGSLYIADTDNHRIQHLAADGSPLHVWGSFGDAATGATGGQFNQPWGIGLGPDGSVYVADTWNHRVQKFGPDGQFITMWGYFGQAEQPTAFWGPRDIAVSDDGRVFITDTGNKRVVVFDEDGKYITQFGSAGLGPGQFDEPVGVAVDADGMVYVADTWNQRIQVFKITLNQINYVYERSWDLMVWYGQSLDNKPYINVDPRGFVFAADPEGYRVLQFTLDGQPVRYWGDFGGGLNSFGLPASVAVALDGTVWVTDAGNSRVMQFVMP
jgi:DNA-binding beta-propeller fold protein YncE